VDATTQSGQAGVSYSHPPVIRELTAAPVGALLSAVHATLAGPEALGTSDGLPGASYRLEHYPVLEPVEGEALQVRPPGETDWQNWERRDSFADSGPEDRHFVFDLAQGEVQLGPAVRQGDGRWRQYGAVPPKGAEIRFTYYRHGGGQAGNLRANKLTVLKSAIPGVAAVANPVAASGGVDAESLDSARARAGLEFRTRDRAVTAADYEFLTVNASPRVARAHCPTEDNGNPIEVFVLPRVAEPAARLLTLEELTPAQEMLDEVVAYLDERRMVGTTVQVRPTRLYALSVVVNVEVAPSAELARVEEDIESALYAFLNPLIGGSLHGSGGGWPYGRALHQGELFGLVHTIEDVELVNIVRMYEANLTTLKQKPNAIGPYIEIARDQVIASGPHVVKASYAGD
jgi:predicted phage baseplate assembly protein